MADGLLNKASIILTPTGYKAGTLYNVAPVVEPYEDFDFARASVASRVNSSGLVEMVGRTLSSELVQNGDFSELGNNVLSSTWSTGSGWSVITDGVSCDGSVSGGNVVNNVELTDYNGKQFLLTYTLSNVTDSSTLRYKFGGGSLVVINGTEGTHSVYITNDATVDNFQFVSSTGWAGDVTNISVKQVDPNDRWTLTGGWSIADNKLSCDGTNDSLAYQSLSSLNLGDTLKVTYTVSDYTSGTLRIGTGAALQQPSGIARTSSGTYVEYITKTDGVAAFGFRSYSFNGSIDNVSVKEVIDTNNIPRISYDSNGENGHILLEPTSTNLLPYSEDFTETITQSNSVLVTSNQAISPDGTLNADKLIPASGNVQSNGGRYYQFSSTGGTDYSVSIFVKQAEYRYVTFTYGSSNAYGFHFDLQDGVILQNINNPQYTGISREVESLDNGWYRLKVSLTDENTAFNRFISVRPANAIPTATNNNYSTIGDGTSGIYAWGFQLEALSYTTSYIPTLTGSTETRATETATGAGSADLINSTEGVLYAEIAALADDISGFRVLGISDGGSTNRIFIGYTSNNIYANVGAGTTIGSPYTPTNASDFHKVALKYENNNCKFFVDGSQIGSTTTSITIPSGMNSLQFDSGAGGSDFYGKCKALAVFNEALSDSELTQLTT